MEARGGEVTGLRAPQLKLAGQGRQQAQAQTARKGADCGAQIRGGAPHGARLSCVIPPQKEGTLAHSCCHLRSAHGSCTNRSLGARHWANETLNLQMALGLEVGTVFFLFLRAGNGGCWKLEVPPGPGTLPHPLREVDATEIYQAFS